MSEPDQTPEALIRAWAKAYRESPEHRFPSDPHAEFFPVDLEFAADEIDRLRKQIEIALSALRHVTDISTSVGPAQDSHKETNPILKE